MKKLWTLVIVLSVVFILTGCATVPQDRYNTQKGAAIGAGVGAIGGQIIGGNTESTLIGAAVGTLLGAIVGNAVDQSYQASREAALTNKRVVYYDNQGGAVEAIPGPVNQSTKCRKVTKRVWKNGKLISETVEEICEGQKTTTEY
ncbi:MAG: glycine zipper 2TM domain-containing protein [Deltaproteobacteria bacterium]|nr:glycine zipper 2TM domain-containing protein [Deltaproteobacteria bacterium]MBW2018038.1 glycine zipper 2TM domain-containing protein [Deltaproteobacteria bacterium]MBW2129299.1 glycine zipper 2TM domain-containing protein [Deltaproteobacteria bacterium]MBW2302075.1 glycine zipper 2TM domain-containing protein [Deltaproteobacteria bacterium]